MINTKDFYKKLIFFIAIIAVGLVSRVAYEMNSNTAAAKGAAAGSLAMISENVASGSGAVPDAFSHGSISGADKSAFAASVPDAAAGYSGAASGNSSTAQNNINALSGLHYEAALVADLQTGAISFGDNDAKRWPLASVTKLMTATVVMDNLDMNQKVTITPDAFAAYPEEKTLRVGDVYTVFDLLHFLLMPSSNVAAEALADACGRLVCGRTNFINVMNARAVAWGMVSTHYDDPSGLSRNNKSTADDLLLLAQKIYSDYPEILAITRTAQFNATELNTGTVTSVKSINDFAGESDFIGGKTGYTNSADGNLLSIFNDNGRPILVIVLGTNEADRFANTEKLYDWFKGQAK